MTIHIGIGGWTFEPWRGTFYPPKHPQKRELEYAGQHLTGIEINGTYYGSQKPESFANWAASVPDGFKFSVKASRFTTNRKILADGAGSIEKFLTQGLTRLGDRLGPIHWQFMATKKFVPRRFRGFPRPAARHAGRPAAAPRDRGAARKLPRSGVCRHAARAEHGGRLTPTATNFPASTNRPPISPMRDCSAARKMSKPAMTTRRSTHWAKQARDWAKGDRDVFLFFISGAKVRNPAAAQALIAKLK